MRKKYKIGFLILVLVIGVVAFFIVLHGKNIAVLNPKGPIAEKERNLILFALGLSLIVVVPVYTLLFTFAWRYREGNKKAKYSPNLSGNKIAEALWWLIPTAIIGLLAVVTWKTTYELNPYNSIASNNKPIYIDVVALDWKWLFIYPQQNIATVNYIRFPMNTPLKFNITSDTVMNSFWIPQLGSQIYAMPGMDTQLNLLASTVGSFYGSSANISGSGFAGMTFTAQSTSSANFNTWVKQAQKTPTQLSLAAYKKLSEPSQYNPVAYYSAPDKSLYGNIIMNYMGATQTASGTTTIRAGANNSGNTNMNYMDMP